MEMIEATSPLYNSDPAYVYSGNVSVKLANDAQILLTHSGLASPEKATYWALNPGNTPITLVTVGMTYVRVHQSGTGSNCHCVSGSSWFTSENSVEIPPGIWTQVEADLKNPSKRIYLSVENSPDSETSETPAVYIDDVVLSGQIRW